MGILTEAAICILVICVTAIVIAAMISRMKTQANATSEHVAAYDAITAQSRAQADAERESRAIQLYALQSAMQTIQGQAQAAAYTQAQTVHALDEAIKGIAAGQETVRALEELHARAVADVYTRLCLTDGGTRKNARYWEEADFYA